MEASLANGSSEELLKSTFMFSWRSKLHLCAYACFVNVQPRVDISSCYCNVLLLWLLLAVDIEVCLPKDLLSSGGVGSDLVDHRC